MEVNILLDGAMWIVWSGSHDIGALTEAIQGSGENTSDGTWIFVFSSSAHGSGPAIITRFVSLIEPGVLSPLGGICAGRKTSIFVFIDLVASVLSHKKSSPLFACQGVETPIAVNQWSILINITTSPPFVEDSGQNLCPSCPE